jgi:hypothetical protein
MRSHWWREAKVNRWDGAVAIALAVVVGLVLQPALLGNGWGDDWIAAVSWFVILVPLIEVRRRLSRRSREF